MLCAFCDRLSPLRVQRLIACNVHDATCALPASAAFSRDIKFNSRRLGRDNIFHECKRVVFHRVTTRVHDDHPVRLFT